MRYFCNESIFICRYWCSTKVDDNLEHIGGQGNWGFCRQSCTTIALDTTSLRPIITAASEVYEAASTGDFFQLIYRFSNSYGLLFPKLFRHIVIKKIL